MAAELKKLLGDDVDIKLIPSGGGVFEVVADGKLIFSKRNLGRFPNDGEVPKLINR